MSCCHLNLRSETWLTLRAIPSSSHSYALALQLHSEESDRLEAERRYRSEQRRQGRADPRYANTTDSFSSNQRPTSQQQNKRNSGIFSSLGVGRRPRQQAPSSRYAPPPGPPPPETSQHQQGSLSYAVPPPGSPEMTDADAYAAQTPPAGAETTEDASRPSAGGRNKKDKNCIVM